MESSQGPRSVKIGEDERGGWSSDRPRRGGGPPRPADISTRCSVLRPTDALRYSPGSLLLIASPSADERDRFTDRLIESKSALLSIPKVRALLEGRVTPEEIDERAEQLLEQAARKRFEAGETVVISTDGLDPGERERYVRLAHSFRRPRHIILLEVSREAVPEDSRAALNDLRKRLDSGGLGAEGFQTALRLGGEARSEVKRIVFAPPPRDE
jgi:hypothetical protein